MAKTTAAAARAAAPGGPSGAAPARRRSAPQEIDRADRDPEPAPPRATGRSTRQSREAAGADATPAGSPAGGSSEGRPAAAARTTSASAAPTPAAGGRAGGARSGGRSTASKANSVPTPQTTRLERADIGLTGEQEAGVSRILNRALSDEHVLYIRTRNYHWNVTGMQFKALHEFFEEQYKQLEVSIDEIAERTRALGIRAIGSMAEFLQNTRLQEQNPAEVPDATGMLRNLLADHEAIIRHLRDDINACEERFGDAGTADFLTGMLSAHEKMAWMIRAFLS